MPPLSRSSSSVTDLVYQKLRNAILSGQFGPGDHLVERQLAKQFGVSRTSLRTAVMRLERHGLAARRRSRGSGGYGYEVASATGVDLGEVISIRSALESLATRLAAERATGSDIGELERLLSDLDRAREAGDARGLEQAHFAFHDAVYRCARSPRLRDLLGGLQDWTRLVVHLGYQEKGRIDAAFLEHRDLVRAIAERDGYLAERLSRRHIENSRTAYLQALTNSQKRGVNP